MGPDWWDLDPADGRWHAVYEISVAELWTIHCDLKRRLLELSKERAETPHEIDMNALTIGFGRRFAPYKRANLLLRDRPRLTKLLRNTKRPVQILFAGKSHPADQPGKDIVAGIVGLAQLIALRYGTIPVVRATGGLADTIRDYDPVAQKGNGFRFGPYDPWQFFAAVVRAAETFRHPTVWQWLIQHDMQEDVSWSRSAYKYVQLYLAAIAAHRERHGVGASTEAGSAPSPTPVG